MRFQSICVVALAFTVGVFAQTDGDTSRENRPKNIPCRVEFRNGTLIRESECQDGSECSDGPREITRRGEERNLFFCKKTVGNDHDDKDIKSDPSGKKAYGKKAKPKNTPCRVEFRNGTLIRESECQDGSECSVGPREKTRRGEERNLFFCKKTVGNYHDDKDKKSDPSGKKAYGKKAKIKQKKDKIIKEGDAQNTKNRKIKGTANKGKKRVNIQKKIMKFLNVHGAGKVRNGVKSVIGNMIKNSRNDGKNNKTGKRKFARKSAKQAKMILNLLNRKRARGRGSSAKGTSN